jgi:predicted patatin/cPLA2 family phospholipase
MVQQIALQSAIDAGATHVLVLLTRKMGELERPNTVSRFSLERMVLRVVYGKEFVDVFDKRNADINAVLERILHPSNTDNLRIGLVVRPETGCAVGRLTTDEDLLRQADAEGRGAVAAFLDVPPARNTPIVSQNH